MIKSPDFEKVSENIRKIAQSIPQIRRRF